MADGKGSREERLKNYKTKGIVLKTMNLGEADKIITIYTEKEGKVAAVAKGIRRPKSRFGARLEVFTNLNLIIHRGKSLDIITNANTIDPHLGVISDLNKINYGYAMLELIVKIAPEGQADVKIYRLLAAALDYLSKTDIDSKVVLVTFNLKLLAITGFLPDLSVCVVCGDKDKQTVKYSPDDGGMLCGGCRSSGGEIFAVKQRVILLARRLLYTPFVELGKVPMEKKSLTKLAYLLRVQLSYHLNIKLKSEAFLDK